MCTPSLRCVCYGSNQPCTATLSSVWPDLAPSSGGTDHDDRDRQRLVIIRAAPYLHLLRKCLGYGEQRARATANDLTNSARNRTRSRSPDRPSCTGATVRFGALSSEVVVHSCIAGQLGSGGTGQLFQSSSSPVCRLDYHTATHLAHYHNDGRTCLLGCSAPAGGLPL
jgi:hypothetical protein